MKNKKNMEKKLKKLKIVNEPLSEEETKRILGGTGDVTYSNTCILSCVGCTACTGDCSSCSGTCAVCIGCVLCESCDMRF